MATGGPFQAWARKSDTDPQTAARQDAWQKANTQALNAYTENYRKTNPNYKSYAETQGTKQSSQGTGAGYLAATAMSKAQGNNQNDLERTNLASAGLNKAPTTGVNPPPVAQQQLYDMKPGRYKDFRPKNYTTPGLGFGNMVKGLI